VIADTGNNRVQVLDASGNVIAVVPGLSAPRKAILVDNFLIVCNTGAGNVLIYESSGSGYILKREVGGFKKPVYACKGIGDDIWIADNELGRVIAIQLRTLERSGWQFPPAEKPGVEDLRGIAYDESVGDLVYVDGKKRAILRRHLLD
jgi:hypothetical protein